MKLSKKSKNKLIKIIDTAEHIWNIFKKVMLVIIIFIITFVMCSIDSLIDLMPTWLSITICIIGLLVFILKAINLVNGIDEKLLSRLYIDNEEEN